MLRFDSIMRLENQDSKFIQNVRLERYDEVETDYDYHTPEKANGYKKFVAFWQLTPLVDDSEYTIKLQVKGGNTAQTINTRRIRFMVMQE